MKQWILRFVFAVFLMASAASSYSVAADSADDGEREVGNGGNVIVCRESDGKVQSIELLDFYESRVLRKIEPALGEPNLPVHQKVKLAVSRLKELSPDRYRLYSEWLESFPGESALVPNANLIVIPDSHHLLLPKGCQIEQIVIQQEVKRPDDKRYIINKDLWDQLKNDDKAGLILHEIIYREAVYFNQHKDSIPTRHFTSYLASLKVKGMSLPQFVKYLNSLDFYKIEILGFSFHPRSLKFYDSGNLEKGSLEPPLGSEKRDVITAFVRIKGSRYKFIFYNAEIVFSDSSEHAVIGGTPYVSDAPKVPIGDKMVSLGDRACSLYLSHFEVYPEGTFKYLVLAAETKLKSVDGSDVLVPSGVYVYFDKNERFIRYGGCVPESS